MMVRMRGVRSPLWASHHRLELTHNRLDNDWSLWWWLPCSCRWRWWQMLSGVPEAPSDVDHWLLLTDNNNSSLQRTMTLASVPSSLSLSSSNAMEKHSIGKTNCLLDCFQLQTGRAQQTAHTHWPESSSSSVLSSSTSLLSLSFQKMINHWHQNLFVQTLSFSFFVQPCHRSSSMSSSSSSSPSSSSSSLARQIVRLIVPNYSSHIDLHLSNSNNWHKSGIFLHSNLKDTGEYPIDISIGIFFSR